MYYPTNLLAIIQSDFNGYEELAEELSEKYDLKMTESTLYRYASGERTPPLEVYLAVADHYNVSPDQVAGCYCPMCLNLLPSNSFQIDRFGTKTSSRSNKPVVIDCLNCGYLAMDKHNQYFDDELEISYFENESTIVTDYIRAFRRENNLEWHDVIEVEVECIIDQVINRLTLRHDTNAKTYMLHPIRFGFVGGASTIANVSAPSFDDSDIILEGTNENGYWRLVSLDDEPADIFELEAGTCIAKNTSATTPEINIIRNQIISSDHVIEHENCYEFTRSFIVRNTQLAEMLVKGIDQAEVLNNEFLFAFIDIDTPEKVSNYEDVLNNAKTYAQLIEEKNPFFYSNMSSNTYWYYFPEIDTFAANKFLAYKNNNYLLYKHFTNKKQNRDKMDGGHANRILSNFFVKTSDPSILKKFDKFKLEHNIKETKRIRNAEIRVKK